MDRSDPKATEKKNKKEETSKDNSLSIQSTNFDLTPEQGRPSLPNIKVENNIKLLNRESVPERSEKDKSAADGQVERNSYSIGCNMSALIEVHKTYLSGISEEQVNGSGEKGSRIGEGMINAANRRANSKSMSYMKWCSKPKPDKFTRLSNIWARSNKLSRARQSNHGKRMSEEMINAANSWANSQSRPSVMECSKQNPYKYKRLNNIWARSSKLCGARPSNCNKQTNDVLEDDTDSCESLRNQSAQTPNIYCSDGGSDENNIHAVVVKEEPESVQIKEELDMNTGVHEYNPEQTIDDNNQSDLAFSQTYGSTIYVKQEQDDTDVGRYSSESAHSLNNAQGGANEIHNDLSQGTNIDADRNMIDGENEQTRRMRRVIDSLKRGTRNAQIVRNGQQSYTENRRVVVIMKQGSRNTQKGRNSKRSYTEYFVEADSASLAAEMQEVDSISCDDSLKHGTRDTQKERTTGSQQSYSAYFGEANSASPSASSAAELQEVDSISCDDNDYISCGDDYDTDEELKYLVSDTDSSEMFTFDTETDEERSFQNTSEKSIQKPRFRKVPATSISITSSDEETEKLSSNQPVDSPAAPLCPVDDVNQPFSKSDQKNSVRNSPHKSVRKPRFRKVQATSINITSSDEEIQNLTSNQPAVSPAAPLCPVDEVNKSFSTENLHTPSASSTFRPTFKCSFCGKAFKQIKNLRQHLKRHLKETIKQAKEGQTSSSMPRFQASESESEETEQTEEIKTSDAHNTINIATDGDSEPREGQPVKENDDHKAVPSTTKILRPYFSCSLCNKSFSKIKSVKKHLVIHKGPKKAKPQCEICNKEFSNLMVLKDHINIHTGDRPYQCEDCGTSYQTRHALKSHLSRGCSCKVDGESVKCSFCPKVVNKHLMKAHLRNFHNDDDKPYQCHLCSWRFKIRGHLNRHLKSHEKGTIQYGIGYQKNILKNGERNSGRGREYKCEDCGKVYNELRYLRRHMVIHSGARDHKCRFCHKRYRYISNLQRHELLHKGGLRFRCGVCDKTFYDSHGLSLHLEGNHLGKFCQYRLVIVFL